MKKRFLLSILSLALVAAFSVSCNMQDQLPQNQLNTYVQQEQQEHKTPISEQTTPNTNENVIEDTQESQETEAPAVRKEPRAMDFTVYDANGNSVKLSDFFGKPIVLNFWASWCPPCKGEMPDFHTKYLELGKEVQFLMINMTGGRETVSSAKKFIEEQGYTFPVFYDTAYEAADVYKVYSLPTTHFIDAEGYLIAYYIGAINADTLQSGIDMIH